MKCINGMFLFFGATPYFLFSSAVYKMSLKIVIVFLPALLNKFRYIISGITTNCVPPIVVIPFSSFPARPTY